MAINSIYPRNIPAFPDHRNILDDVDANDINNIQRELTAVAEVIGPMPHVYNDIALPSIITSETPGDVGDLSEVSYTATSGPYIPGATVVNHGTVSHRLDNIERGKQTHVFGLSASHLNFPKSADVNLSSRPRGVRFPKPSSTFDPNGMYNGMGVNLRKSGFWSLQASVIVNLSGTQADRTGTFVAAIDYDNNFIQGMARHRTIQGSVGGSVALTPVLQGYLGKGTRISLRIAHDSGVNHSVRLAVLTGFLVREFDF